MAIERIGLGGGCHWCTEAVFQSLPGVGHVDQGFLRSIVPNESLSEGVVVHFDPAVIALAELVEAHLHTHASTSAHSMRHKYRSAVYAFDDAQAREARKALADLQSQFDAPLITQVLPFAGFAASDERFRNYYATDPDRPFCRTHIAPKLARLRALSAT
jgi:peptide-methionine (S)-S-oxide reductase